MKGVCSKEALASLTSHRARRRAPLSVGQSQTLREASVGASFPSLVWESWNREEAREKTLGAVSPARRSGTHFPTGSLSRQPRVCAPRFTGVQSLLSFHRGELRGSGIRDSSAEILAKFTSAKPCLLWCNRQVLWNLVLLDCPPEKGIFSNNFTSRRIIWLKGTEAEMGTMSSYAISPAFDLGQDTGLL